MSLKITKELLDGMYACDGAMARIRRLLPATVYVNPEKNLKLAMKLVRAYDCNYELLVDHLDWLLHNLWLTGLADSPRYQDDTLAMEIDPVHYNDVSVIAQVLGWVADREHRPKV